MQFAAAILAASGSYIPSLVRKPGLVDYPNK